MEILTVDARCPEPERVACAAAVLRAGGLVAFPTETVYGLGANALAGAACARIYAAKGRPANNPIIVHVAGPAEARHVVAAWPAAAERLAARFWPGPLTLVLPKQPAVPDIVTAGGPTVAVRVPAHPVALALLRAAGIPVAAPSANRSGELSPTRAGHIHPALAEHIDILLDGGPCPGGVESTVLDLSRSPPRLLRPGLVTPAEIEAVVGPVERPAPTALAGQPLPAPGMLARHYAPRAPLECVAGDRAPARVAELAGQGRCVGWVKCGGPGLAGGSEVNVVVLPANPPGYAALLYDVLHGLDRAGVERIVVDWPPETDDWLAVRDRLRRAATPG